MRESGGGDDQVGCGGDDSGSEMGHRYGGVWWFSGDGALDSVMSECGGRSIFFFPFSGGLSEGGAGELWWW